ncbi:hypothetical protein [Streptomyces sp. P9-A2]|uniref:hypothetical protein n=1 Tax=Streptomyces sp. P9-A2 TaxID=3072284 RepID=UPI002FCC1A0A
MASWILSVRTVGELRAALVMGYGFPGDADDCQAEPAGEVNRADPAGLSGVVRLVEESRGRVMARQGSAFDTAAAAAVAEIQTARRTARTSLRPNPA